MTGHWDPDPSFDASGPGSGQALTHGFRLILDAAGVERIVWPASDAGISDLTAERARQRREVAEAVQHAEFAHELDDDGIVALKRCVHTGVVGRCDKQGTKRADGSYRCSGHFRVWVEAMARG